MSRFRQEIGAVLRRPVTFAAILALHLLLIRAIWTTTVDAVGHAAPAPLRIDLIPHERPREPIPPPVLHWQDPARLMVTAPEVSVEVADDPPPIVASTPAAPEVPVAAPPAAPPSAARSPTVPPRPLYVPGGMDRYPPESRRARESGSPAIRVCISATGAVESVEVARSSGFPRLDAAALGIGREARFRPATLDGQPVPDCRVYRIRFGFSG